MSRSRSLICLFVTCLALAVTPVAHAQVSDFTIRGRILTDAGEPPDGLVLARLRCSGYEDETTVAPSGEFRFNILAAKRLSPGRDSTPGGSGLQTVVPEQLSLCTLLVSASGRPSLQLPLVSLTGRNLDLGTIFLPGDQLPGLGHASSTVNLRNLKLPREAVQAVESARLELSRPDPDADQALKRLSEAVDIAPEFVEAWNRLGMVESSLGNLAQARKAFERAERIDPENVVTLILRADLECRRNDWRSALRYSKKAVRVDPRAAAAHYIRALAAFNLGELETARHSCGILEDSGQSRLFPQLEAIQGLLLIDDGRVQEGKAAVRRFLEAHPDSASAVPLQRRLQRLEDEQPERR